jgi:glycerol-3-phosphate dehydrogenase subunit C
VDGVEKSDFNKVVDDCYLCDLCYMTKCPYVPPHEWAIDFPHLMLRAKAQRFKRNGASLRDRVLTSTDVVGKIASIPVIVQAVNKANSSKAMRKALDFTLGIHSEAPLPTFHSDTARRRIAKHKISRNLPNKIGLFVTCYGDKNAPSVVGDMMKVFEHNDIGVEVLKSEQCCGMPKFELGDLSSVEKLMEKNIPALLDFASKGMQITAPIPSCVLMYRQELPLLFPDSEDVTKVQAAFVDPFEFLLSLHEKGALKTNFSRPFGKLAYHVPCHQRVQNIGRKTKQVLELVPESQVIVIERCSGHDGTYAVKKEHYESAKKICKPVVKRITDSEVDQYLSDCPMAGDLIAQGVDGIPHVSSAFSILKTAYGI